jgi:hypothetical protein
MNLREINRRHIGCKGACSQSSEDLLGAWTIAGSRIRIAETCFDEGRKAGEARSASAAPQARTVYAPSMNDPRIVAALNARKRLGEAMLSGDFKTVETIFAPDLVVHSPINMVVNRENVLARLRSGQISYEPNVEERIEFAGVRGGAVVLMGEEIVQPIRNAPNVGKTVHRRFTDIWKNLGGLWKLAIRQATVTSVE